MKPVALFAELARRAYRFEFFQAVRMLERAARRDPASPTEPRRGNVGEDESPANEVVRFQVPPTLAYPASEIVEFQPATDEKPPRMTVPFLGLIGPVGVLPRHYTQLAIDRQRQKDHTLREFLDLFHHRLISLFYRAWRKFRFVVGYERAIDAGEAGNDDFTQDLQSLVGIGTAGLRGRLEVDDETWLYYAGLFAHSPRNASSLAAMLSEDLGVPAEVRQFVGQWLRLEPPDQSRLSSDAIYDRANNRLGTNTVAGDRVWGVEQKFRVQLGPLTYRQFLQFLPGEPTLLRASQLVRSYVGGEFDFEFQPILRREEVPTCQLGGSGIPSRLGWNSWLATPLRAQDSDDPIFATEGWDVSSSPAGK